MDQRSIDFAGHQDGTGCGEPTVELGDLQNYEVNQIAPSRVIIG
jgi:hypothetical protein